MGLQNLSSHTISATLHPYIRHEKVSPPPLLFHRARSLDSLPGVSGFAGWMIKIAVVIIPFVDRIVGKNPEALLLQPVSLLVEPTNGEGGRDLCNHNLLSQISSWPIDTPWERSERSDCPLFSDPLVFTKNSACWNEELSLTELAKTPHWRFIRGRGNMTSKSHIFTTYMWSANQSVCGQPK